MSSQTCLLPLFPSKESVKLCLLLSVYMFFFYCYGLNYDTVDFFICLKHCPVRAVCTNFLIGEDITVTHCCLHHCHLDSGVYQYTCLSGIHYISQYYLFLSLHKNSKKLLIMYHNKNNMQDERVGFERKCLSIYPSFSS